MKRDRLHASGWMAAACAAMVGMSPGSMAMAADFTAYNDLAWGPGQ